MERFGDDGELVEAVDHRGEHSYAEHLGDERLTDLQASLSRLLERIDPVGTLGRDDGPGPYGVRDLARLALQLRPR